MKNIPAQNIQLVALMIAMLLGLNLMTTTVFAQDTEAAVKIQLLSEALYARDAGDLLLAKEKVDRLIAIAPNDRNVQALLISINQSLEDEGIEVPNNVSKRITKADEVVESEIDSKPINDSPLYKNKNKRGLLNAEDVSPNYVEQKATIEELLLVANSQIAVGDLAGATSTLMEIEARDPNSKEAKLLSLKITKEIDEIQSLNLYKTRENMLSAVNKGWDKPKVFELEENLKSEDVTIPSLLLKLESIVLPKVNFTGMALTRVIETLSELSVEYDSEGEGINIVALFDASELNPNVNITLRNLSIDKILQFVTQQVNFTYQVGVDAVTIQPSDSIGGTSSTITEFFPISRATVIRLTGFRDSSGTSSLDDPFGEGSSNSAPSQDQEKDALQKFFQNAGVNFEGITGTSLAFDGEQLIVTQTPRNIERLRTILRNYSEVKQVEIETKFLEVTQNDLDELGFHWGVGSNKLNRNTGYEDWRIASNLRTLNDLGSSNTGGEARVGVIPENQTESINPFAGAPVTVNPPAVAQSLGYGTANGFFTDRDTFDDKDDPVSFGFALDDLDIDLQIQALARKAGSDLMSAPKVTVLSGKRANIVVAQELRYPQSYGDIESDVSGGQGGSSVAIVAGTPDQFTTRNVGVEMSVTPNVENDNTISLILEPRVTEFEGFVEYGGPSIAVTSDTTAVVPAGFYQPVFSTREITTEVTIYDGATVVMGGLTRDEVRSVNDKVPFLGDIPGIGRLFRSEGETRQKKNLLIFVTANLVTPGGSLSNQSYDNIKANTIYQSPSLETPAGGNFRNITIKD